MFKPLQLIYLFLLINFLILILLNNQDVFTVHNQLTTSSQVNADKFKKSIKKIKKKLFKKLKKKKIVPVPIVMSPKIIKGTLKVHHYHHMPQTSGWSSGWGGGNPSGGWGNGGWGGGKSGAFINILDSVFSHFS